MIPTTVEGFAMLTLAALVAGYGWSIGGVLAGKTVELARRIFG